VEKLFSHSDEDMPEKIETPTPAFSYDDNGQLDITQAAKTETNGNGETGSPAVPKTTREKRASKKFKIESVAQSEDPLYQRSDSPVTSDGMLADSDATTATSAIPGSTTTIEAVS